MQGGFRVLMVAAAMLAVALAAGAPSGPAGVASASTPPRPPGAPADAAYFKGRWFRIYHEDVSWEAAQKTCRKMGGRLAVVPDKETWEFLAEKVGEDYLWLGARDESKEGKWKWVDGSRMTFAAWATGEPDTGRAKQDYVYATKKGWKDIRENGYFNRKLFVHGFICEWHAED